MNKWIRLLRYDWPLHFVLLLTNWLPDNIPFLRLRGFLVSLFVMNAGKNLQVGRNVALYNPSKISFGDNVYIAFGCWFSCGHFIEINNNILIGPYVVIVTSNHSLKNGAYYFGQPSDCNPVIICDGAWIGAHVTILPGSRIEKGVLVAANSVFSKSSIPYGIYAGQPAKLIKVSENG